MLGAAGADDDDRGPDALLARGLDHAPAVTARQHQVEHDDVGPLEAKSCESHVTLAGDDRVEAGGREVLRHPVSDDGVVLDDQDFGHTRCE